MIDDITGHYSGHKSAVLNSVLQLAPPTKQWDTTEDAEEDKTKPMTNQRKNPMKLTQQTNQWPPKISDTDTAYWQRNGWHKH